jgi:hypothetical protein
MQTKQPSPGRAAPCKERTTRTIKGLIKKHWSPRKLDRAKPLIEDRIDGADETIDAHRDLDQIENPSIKRRRKNRERRMSKEKKRKTTKFEEEKREDIPKIEEKSAHGVRYDEEINVENREG